MDRERQRDEDRERVTEATRAFAQTLTSTLVSHVKFTFCFLFSYEDSITEENMESELGE